MSELHVRDRTVSWSRPLLMGVVNVNSDSFSDPGPRTLDTALDMALSLIDSGAAVIDVGAQSGVTRRQPVDPGAEAGALVPLIERLTAARPDVLVSVDTFKQPVARAALAAGAHVVNDVSGLADRGIALLCAEYSAGLVIMHTATAPLTRRQDPGLYANVVEEVAEFLAGRVAVAIGAGVDERSIIVDPGPDFAKTPAQTIALLRGIDRIAALGYPVLLAVSRKDFIGALTGRSPADRDPGTLGAIAALRSVPGQILRVHDVTGTGDMLDVLDAITGTRPIDATLELPDGLRHQSAGKARDAAH